MGMVVALLVGAFLQFAVPASPWVSTVAGVLVGALGTIAGLRRHQPRQAYISPTMRPEPTTVAQQHLAAALAFAAGVAVVVFLWFVPMPRTPLIWGLGFYLGGHGIGTAVAIVLSAQKTVETHNNWLASMTPRTSLDTEL